MIYSPSHEPIEIISGPYGDLLDPSSLDYPFVDIRFIHPPQETLRARLCRLHADGGQKEIETALGKVKDVPSTLSIDRKPGPLGTNAEAVKATDAALVRSIIDGLEVIQRDETKLGTGSRLAVSRAIRYLKAQLENKS